ncbi:MAG: hypothetical protein Q4B58_01700, partial [Bacteroidales bacterium]|nr:hypothetical protein [Bacteroidales bacterium]
MKKVLYSILAIGALFAYSSCDDDNYADWSDPQQNPQEVIVDADVAKAVTDGISSVPTLFDFASLTDENIKVFNPASVQNPTSYEVMFTNGKVVSASNDGKIEASALQAAVIDIFGKRPVEREVDAIVIARTEVEGIMVKAVKDITINAKLVAPEIFPHLYLIGAPSKWDPTCTTMPFTHSGKDVYDDPWFSILFPVEDGDTWFAFADDKTVESNDWSNVFGAVEGNGFNLVGEEGKFSRRADLEDDGSFKVTVNGDAKFIKMTCNMLDGTYLIEKVNFVPYIYLPGNAQGWNPSTAPALVGNGEGLYTGYAYMDGEFKFTQERAWAAEYNNGSFNTCSADFDLGAKDGGNIKCNSTGVYYFEVNVATGELNAIKVETMAMIGGFNGWGDDAVMTWNADELCYEGEANVTDAGWKFRINKDWGINLGGTVNNLVANGDNLDVAGTKVKLYPCRTTSDNIYCVVE